MDFDFDNFSSSKPVSNGSNHQKHSIKDNQRNSSFEQRVSNDQSKEFSFMDDFLNETKPKNHPISIRNPVSFHTTNSTAHTSQNTSSLSNGTEQADQKEDEFEDDFGDFESGLESHSKEVIENKGNFNSSSKHDFEDNSLKVHSSGNLPEIQQKNEPYQRSASVSSLPSRSTTNVPQPGLSTRESSFSSSGQNPKKGSLDLDSLFGDFSLSEKEPSNSNKQMNGFESNNKKSIEFNQRTSADSLSIRANMPKIPDSNLQTQATISRSKNSENEKKNEENDEWGDFETPVETEEEQSIKIENDTSKSSISNKEETESIKVEEEGKDALKKEIEDTETNKMNEEFEDEEWGDFEVPTDVEAKPTSEKKVFQSPLDFFDVPPGESQKEEQSKNHLKTDTTTSQSNDFDDIFTNQNDITNTNQTSMAHNSNVPSIKETKEEDNENDWDDFQAPQDTDFTNEEIENNHQAVDNQKEEEKNQIFNEEDDADWGDFEKPKNHEKHNKYQNDIANVDNNTTHKIESELIKQEKSESFDEGTKEEIQSSNRTTPVNMDESLNENNNKENVENEDKDVNNKNEEFEDEEWGDFEESSYSTTEDSHSKKNTNIPNEGKGKTERSNSKSRTNMKVDIMSFFSGNEDQKVEENKIDQNAEKTSNDFEFPSVGKKNETPLNNSFLDGVFNQPVLSPTSIVEDKGDEVESKSIQHTSKQVSSNTFLEDSNHFGEDEDWGDFEEPTENLNATPADSKEKTQRTHSEEDPKQEPCKIILEFCFSQMNKFVGWMNKINESFENESKKIDMMRIVLNNEKAKGYLKGIIEIENVGSSCLKYFEKNQKERVLVEDTTSLFKDVRKISQRLFKEGNFHWKEQDVFYRGERCSLSDMKLNQSEDVLNMDNNKYHKISYRLYQSLKN